MKLVLSILLVLFMASSAMAQGINMGASGYGGTGGAPGPAGPPGGAPITNPPGGQQNYAPLDNPIFTGTVTTPNINILNFGGSCPDPQAMTGITGTGAVTCTSLGHAPLLNPTGGQNNYAPLIAPNFTGPVTIGGVALGGACPAGQVVSAISGSVIPSCVPLTGIPPPGSTIVGPIFTGTITMPDGSHWSSTGLTNLNLTGNLTFNGAAVGGTCPTGQFMTSLTGQLVPGCSAIGTINNPVFTGTITLPAGSITDTDLHTAYSGIGTCPAGEFVSALNRAAAPTCTPAATGTFAPLVNPSGGQNNYAPLAGPTFTGTVTVTNLAVTGTVTLPSTSIADTALVGAYSGIGSCPAGEFINALTRNTAPTCAAIAGAFAPLTNPAGGQNNYAPLNSPTFTGTVVLPAGTVTSAMLADSYSGIGTCSAGQFVTALNHNLPPTCGTPTFASVSFSGTVTFPDGSTWTSTGLTGHVASFTHLTAADLNVSTLTFGGNPVGGLCPAGEVANGISSQLTPTCVVAGPGGAGLPVNNPTFTGTMTGPTLNLTSGLTFNGVSMGGQCNAGEFVVSISATGIPTCAAAAAGGVVVGDTAPAAPVNGTLWFDTRVVQLFIWYSADGGVTYHWVPTITQAFPPPGVGSITDTMLADAYSGIGACPAGQFVNVLNRNAAPGCASVAAGGVIVGDTAPASPVQGMLWFDTRVVQLFIWYSADGGITYNWVPTITQAFPPPAAGSLTDTMLASSYSGIGTCPAGQFVNTLTRNTAPGCASVTATGGVVVSDTAPLGPSEGMLWFNTADLQTYVWFTSGTASQWVPVIHLGGQGGLAAATVGATAPSNPISGQLWFNSADVQMYTWYTNAWVPVIHTGVGGGGLAAATVSGTAPSSPISGQLWFNSTDVQMYTWFTNAWVPVIHTGVGAGGVAAAISAAAPATATDGQFWYNSSTLQLFIRFNGQWVLI